MYSQEFFLKQFRALDTEALIERLATQPLTEEATAALVSVLRERGVEAQGLDDKVQAAKRDQYLRTNVSNQCDFCGKGLLGAFKAEGQKFCNIDCFHTSRLQLAAQDIGDEQAINHAKALKSGPCPTCRQAHRKPEMHRVHYIASMVFVVTTSTQTSLKCASCARSANLQAALYCATLGWWSMTGIFSTPFRIAANLGEILARKPSAEPSTALVDWARLELAERRLQSAKGGRWSLRA